MDSTRKPAITGSQFQTANTCLKRLRYEQQFPDLARPETQDADDGGMLDFLREEAAMVRANAELLLGDGANLSDRSDFEAARHLTTSELHAAPSGHLVYNAAFSDGVRHCRVAAVRVDDGSLILYDIRSSLETTRADLRNLAFQLDVIEAAGHTVKSVIVVQPNASYERGADPVIDVGEYMVQQDVTADVRAALPEMRARLQFALDVLQSDEDVDVLPGGHCKKPVPCPFYERCHMQQSEHPLSNLPRLHAKRLLPLLEMGIRDIRDIPLGYDNLTEYQKRVRDAVVHGLPYIDFDGLGDEIRQFRYPIHFVDFEAFARAVPPFRGVKPYGVLPFQFSNHTWHEDGTLTHSEYLHQSPGTDPRPSFLSALLDSVGEEGTIAIYSPYEGSRLDELGQAFPHRRDAIEALRDRLVDMLPMVRHNLYHPDFHGSNSIKVVMPVLLPDFTYGDLDIQSGDVASLLYIEMSDPATPLIRREIIADCLLAYNRRDTRAMVRLYGKLLGMVRERNFHAAEVIPANDQSIDARSTSRGVPRR